MFIGIVSTYWSPFVALKNVGEWGYGDTSGWGLRPNVLGDKYPANS